MIWWTKSWNPVIGCTKCSPACENCYAEALHTQRHKALLAGKDIKGESYTYPFDQVAFLTKRLNDPLHWKKPQRIFVGNMGDLFHEDVPDECLDSLHRVMRLCPQHTFMLLTKRPDRMKAYYAGLRGRGALRFICPDSAFPLPNVWLGTTIWDQSSADRAVPLLLSTPAAKRFVSVEPMLGPVALDRLTISDSDGSGYYIDALYGTAWDDANGELSTAPDGEVPMERGLDWVICGGETGPGARPMHPDWPRSLRDQCQAAGVPFFFKQWGEWGDMPWRVFAEKCVAITPDGQTYSPDAAAFNGEALPEDAVLRCRVGKKRAGRVLDGRTWEEVPA